MLIKVKLQLKVVSLFMLAFMPDISCCNFYIVNKKILSISKEKPERLNQLKTSCIFVRISTLIHVELIKHMQTYLTSVKLLLLLDLLNFSSCGYDWKCHAKLLKLLPPMQCGISSFSFNNISNLWVFWPCSATVWPCMLCSMMHRPRLNCYLSLLRRSLTSSGLCMNLGDLHRTKRCSQTYCTNTRTCTHCTSYLQWIWSLDTNTKGRSQALEEYEHWWK